MACGFDFFRSIARAWQAELHVGLTTAEPDIAYKNFMKRYGLRSDDFESVRSTGRGRINLNLPASSRSRHGLRRAPGNLNLHGSSRRRPSPDGVRFPTLEDHVVAEDWADERQFGIVRRGCVDGEQEEKSDDPERIGTHSAQYGTLPQTAQLRSTTFVQR